MQNKRFRWKLWLLCAPGMLGFFLFYLFPFLKTFRYAFINNVFQKQFVGFDNFKRVWENQYFRLALGNTIVFSALGVTLLLILSILLSIGLVGVAKKFSVINNAFLLPMLLPTAGVVAAWRVFFDNDVYFELTKGGNSFIIALPIYLMYLWKNTGMNVILLTAALTQIPSQVLEAAELEGARGFKRFRHITFPLILPTLFFVIILSFVNSMKIFKESFLFYGTSYPPDEVYTIQFYMNNHFQKINYESLACASLTVAVLLGVLIYIMYHFQNKATKDVEL